MEVRLILFLQSGMVADSLWDTPSYPSSGDQIQYPKKDQLERLAKEFFEQCS